MNIDEALAKIVADNNLTSFEVNCNFVGEGDHLSQFGATAHGAGIGQHGCCFGYGDTVAEAIANTLQTAAMQRTAQAVTSIELEVAA